MSKVAISIAEKRLLKHLAAGGSVDDATGQSFVAAFVNRALTDSEVMEVVRRTGTGPAELRFLYTVMIRVLMPNPAIKCGGPLLVPTLVFMEPHRLELLLKLCRQMSEGLTDKEMLRVTADVAETVAKDIWLSHNEAYGEQSLKGVRTSSGCLMIIAAPLAWMVLTVIIGFFG